MDDEFESLSDILKQLPPATPLFLPDELLRIWFPPWTSTGEIDPDSLKSAEEVGARFGCIVKYDDYMQQWCFVKSPISN